MSPLRIVLASDKFKGSANGDEVASSLESGLRQVLCDPDIVSIPIADGGDGTLDACTYAGFERCPVTVEGPTGEVVATSYARQGEVGVVELADASGLGRLGAGPAPMMASTIGTGQVLRAAIEAGCREIVLGVGGSASTDGGMGLLIGLGATVRGTTPGDATDLDLRAVLTLLNGVSLTLAADVDNPLVGPNGAAAVYGPQKGATPDQILTLDAAMIRWADLLAVATGVDHRHSAGAGAAGGTGVAALAALGAQRLSGVEVVLGLVDFEAHLIGADLVVTGEGSIDEQSLQGKAPIGVVRAAQRNAVPVVAVCGRTSLTPRQLRAEGIVRTWALSDIEPDIERSIRGAAGLLQGVGVEIGREALALSGRDR